MKGAPVLHWPKLFEGWMLTGEYRSHGDGELSGDGMGGGYVDGSAARRGNGYGYGYGNGNGNDCGDVFGNGSGGGAYSYIDGEGWSRRSV
jgi:hypothetical protein